VAVVAGLGAAVAAAPGLPNWLIALAPCLPAAVWAAARFGPPGAAAANLLTAGVVSALVLGGVVGDDRLSVALFAAVVGLTAVCVGATAAERDEAVRAAAAGRERFRALLAHGHDIVGVLGPDGRAEYLNEAAARLTGHPPDWLLGGDPLNSVHPDDLPGVRAALARAAAAPGVPVTVELRFRRADGGWAWFEAVATDLRADPAVGGVVVNARDVTARKEAERAAAETEARFRNLFEAAPVAIWEEDLSAVGGWFDRLRAAGVTDLRAHLAARPDEVAAAVGMIRVRAVNRAAVEMNAARDAADLVANLPRLFTPSALASVVDILAGLWDGRTTVRAENRAVRLDGTPIDLVLRLAVPEAGGRPDLSRAVLITLDVTEQKRLEREGREAAKLDAVGRLAGGIAHDFNNLLTVVTGFAEVLAAGLPPGSAEADAAGRITAAADRAAALTRQLLAFGRRHPAHPVPLDVAAVLRNLEPDLRRLAGPGVRLALRPAAGLPVVRADQGQFERVVANLAANAAEAMPAGGDLTVAAEAADGGVGGDDVPPGRYVVVSVSDTGPGIPDEVRPHLFEPFFTTKDVGQGPGLGLATVHGIVAQAGGHVRYETAAGRGTTFRVYWPAAGSPGQPPRTPPPPPPAPAATLGTVLLAEDDPAIRALSAQILTAAGWEVAAAGSGPDALARLAGLPAVDVLVTDVVMPGMDGRELADRVRAAAPGVRVVFVSGYAPSEVLPADLGPGEVFLPKPFTPDQLARAVRGVVGGGQ
jgi:PAS domain S-box-containing protein